MLVYGDCRRTESPRSLIAALRRQLRARPRSDPSSLRTWSTSFLIAAGELVQGLLDFEGERECDDRFREHEHACRRLALGAARLYLATQTGPHAPSLLGIARALDHILQQLARRLLPPSIEIRTPEGYAYYAVYPVLYARAARTLEEWGGDWVVLGIRSIGTSLGAVVAAAAGTDELYFVRPTGPPFRRTLPLDGALAQVLVTHGRHAHYAVVDEGPGLSGSSFGAAADCLQSHGVASSRIHFFPSHGGDLGPRASARHRERWKRAHRCHSSFESYFDEARLRSLLFDACEGELRDISAGRWRAELYHDPADWPAVHPGMERRKYLLAAPGRARIAKFVGLGAYGRAQVERAFSLHRHGFIPRPLAYREGFLISTWCETATPLDRTQHDRARFLVRAAEYLAFLQTAYRGMPGGASAADLLTMAVANTTEKLGREAGAELQARWGEHLAAIAARCAPIATDNRLHAWEWLSLAEGGWLKADALEHHADHGLVGCQDLAWDLAGLRIEHALTDAEYQTVVQTIERATGYLQSAEKEDFFLNCYLAYQMGYYDLAADAAWDPTDKGRAERRRDHYAARLGDLLGGEQRATARPSATSDGLSS